MINTIIYTKDRPSQLRLLLESIKKNAPDTFSINILVKSSTKEFEEGYQKLKAENILDSINWVEETDFKVQNIALIKSDKPFTCFFTDDDIIYQSFDKQQIIDTLQSDDDIFCFSLRLGKNVTKCYTMNASNVLVPLEENDYIVKWDWTVHYMDYGYPLSVDGHIFHTADIGALCNKVGYVNPNTFEAALQIFDTFPKERMACFLHSKVVNSPTNIVQSVFPNRQGEHFGVPAQELNQRYLKGEVIDLNQIDFSSITGCHQELDFKYITA